MVPMPDYHPGLLFLMYLEKCMATALVPCLSDKLSSARAFARSLNILLKHVRLYGLRHKRSTDQFDQAWSLLRSVLSGETGFLFGVSGSKLLLDGVPME